MENYNKLKSLVAGIEADADKFYNNGNSAAGTRVRKGLQDIKTLAQEIRNEVTAKKNDEKKIVLILNQQKGAIIR